MKGAYQYGFFRKVYASLPDFRIDKIYCASVGSLNAMPIMTRRIDYLTRFWESNKNPIDEIMVRWRASQIHDALCARTLYSRMDVEKISSFWDECSEEERATLANVTVMSYDQNTGKAVLDRCETKEDAIRGITSSCCFPGLYPPDPQRQHIIDGLYIDNVYSYLPTDSPSPWIYLDLTSLVQDGRKRFDRGKEKNAEELVFGPSHMSDMSCIDFRASSIRRLIEYGEEDALRLIAKLGK